VVTDEHQYSLFLMIEPKRTGRPFWTRQSLLFSPNSPSKNSVPNGWLTHKEQGPMANVHHRPTYLNLVHPKRLPNQPSCTPLLKDWLQEMLGKKIALEKS